MICKECGAYNPDHAEFCKVCAANLKGKPATAEPEITEEEPQPTKRFSRPSWMPDAAEQPVAQAVETAEETVEDAAEEVTELHNEVEETVEDAVEEVPEIEEEETVPAWSPVQNRRRAAKAEEPEEDDENDDDDSEGIYNDEEALESDEDSFEYEPTPPKRRSQKKKSNPLFTVLLIAIIVVIVGILVLGGYWLLTKGKTAPEKNNGDATQVGNLDNENPSGETPSSAAPSSLDSRNAQLQEMRDDNNNDMIAITVVVPANSSVVIDFPNQDDYVYTNSEGKDVTRKVKIPVEVFYPNKPLEETTIEFQPDITINAADGSSYKVECPTFTRTFPKLNITVTAPVPEGEEPIMAPESNIISLTGTIDDPTAEVTINGVGTVVYTGGVFMYDYKFADNATEDTEDTITIVATKNNCVSDTKEIKVHAYKFIPETMKLEVKSDAASLRADKNGKLTVTGVTLPGATLTATSDNSTNVLCGSVNVDGEGNFSFQITTDASFYGMSTITLNAVKEGAEDGSTTFKITRGFADKETFVKYYNKVKKYIEVSPKKTQISDLINNQSQYANAYGVRVSAKVVEVINVDGDQIVKMTVNKTNETIYVHNLSTKWAPGENIDKLYNVYTNFVGTYSDTGCAEFMGWFATAVK